MSVIKYKTSATPDFTTIKKKKCISYDSIIQGTPAPL